MEASDKDQVKKTDRMLVCTCLMPFAMNSIVLNQSISIVVFGVFYHVHLKYSVCSISEFIYMKILHCLWEWFLIVNMQGRIFIALLIHSNIQVNNLQTISISIFKWLHTWWYKSIYLSIPITFGLCFWQHESYIVINGWVEHHGSL